MRHAGAEARELPHGRLDGEADRPHGLVDRLDGVDGTVRRGIQLVELRVHPVDRSPNLVDHGQNLTFCPTNQRRKSVESYGEPEERPADADTDGDQEERQGRAGEISVRESKGHMRRLVGNR